MRAEYELVDVFTDVPFGGNQLALFPDARDIPDALLQHIARELNLSETAFAYQLGPAEWRLRIFTPTMEHPFAGHPTIGSALLLSARCEAQAGSLAIALHEGVGRVDVIVEIGAGERKVARMSVPSDPQAGPGHPHPDELAEMLSLAPDDVLPGDWRPQAFSCGVPFQFVCVRDVAALGRAQVRHDLWAERISGSWAPHLYVLVPPKEGAIRSRMFAPAMGIAEDPATGGAAAALAGYLAGAEEAGPEAQRSWTIEQGVEMGRPSRLELRATVERGAARAVTIGGSGVPMGSGYLELPTEEPKW